MRVYHPNIKGPDGGRKPSLVWWVQFHLRGKHYRRSLGTRDKGIAWSAELGSGKPETVSGPGSQIRPLDAATLASGLVVRIGEDWALGRSGAEGWNRWAARLEAVRPAEVQGFAQRHWTADRLRTVIAGPLGRVLSATDAPAQALRLEASALDLDRPTLRR